MRNPFYRPLALLLTALFVLGLFPLPVVGADSQFRHREGPLDALPSMKELAADGNSTVVFSGGNGALFVGSYVGGKITAREYVFNPDGSGIRTLEHVNGSYWLCTNSGALYTSADGTNWTGVAALPFAINGMVHQGKAYYAPGQGGILYSSDGRTWITSYASNVALYDITYGKGILVAVGEQGTVVYSEQKEWRSVQPGGETRPFYGVAYGNGVFVAGGGTGWGGTGMVYTSGDGAAWQKSHSYEEGYNTPDENGDVCFENCSYAVSWIDGQFVATGLNRITNGFVMTSSSGKQWDSTRIPWGKDVAEARPGVPLLVTSTGYTSPVMTVDASLDTAYLEVWTAPQQPLSPSNPVTPRFTAQEPDMSADYKY